MSVTQLNDMLPNRRQMTVEDDEFISVSEGRIRIRIGDGVSIICVRQSCTEFDRFRCILCAVIDGLGNRDSGGAATAGAQQKECGDGDRNNRFKQTKFHRYPP